MSKVLAAACTANVVSVDGLPLAGATVLSEGVAASEGVAILDEDTAFYLTKISPDLKTTIEKLIDVLTQVKAGLDKVGSALTSIDGKPTGGTGSAPVALATADITSIATAATAIATLKTELTTLKGALR